jgi:glycosyltransferase involved in cell wall biosynthesis
MSQQNQNSFKICIITHAHLSRNPRVVKEAKLFAGLGYQVAILNCIYSNSLLKEDIELIAGLKNIQTISVVDLSKRSLISTFDRAIKKVSEKLVQHFHLQLPSALGYGYYRYLRIAEQLNAHLYVCHQELPTIVGCQLIRKGFNVAFDFEDWYSEDLLPSAQDRRPKKLLNQVEQYALENARYSITTSRALAKALAHKYKSTEPNVIYNVFPIETKILSSSKSFTDKVKLFWFSQTIGPGRGLEAFIDCLCDPELHAELHLLGAVNDNYRVALNNIMPRHIPLVFHDLVHPDELAEKISEFDIGLALEQITPPSRNFTITNKFFQYINSGLPLIATDTAGQRELFDEFSPGILISQNYDATDKAKIKSFITDSSKLTEARSFAISCAHKYSWETQSQILTNLVRNAIESQSSN